MDDEVTRLRVKLGAAEIEYEGGTQFLKDEIMPTVGKILQLVGSSADLQKPAPAPLQIEKATEAETVVPAGHLDLSTNTIATLLEAQTASDLAFAAVGYLVLVRKKERVTRQEILDEMKTATMFFKSTYVGNHTYSLKALIKVDHIRLGAEGTYSLSSKGRKELEAVLARAD